MWELDYKENWMPKNWCFWTVVLEEILESPLDCKEIQPVYPKGNQSWIFIGRTDAEAETLKLWPPDAKNWLIGKEPDAGKDWRQEEKGMTEDEMFGWHHWLDGHEFEQPLGAGDREACGPAVHGVTTSHIQLSDWTEGTQSRFFSSVSTLQETRAIVPAKAPYAHLLPWEFQMDLSKSLLVLGSPILVDVR